jgi:hypothetical protein
MKTRHAAWGMAIALALAALIIARDLGLFRKLHHALQRGAPAREPAQRSYVELLTILNGPSAAGN